MVNSIYGSQTHKLVRRIRSVLLYIQDTELFLQFFADMPDLIYVIPDRPYGYKLQYCVRSVLLYLFTDTNFNIAYGLLYYISKYRVAFTGCADMPNLIYTYQTAHTI
jgi:hypothetical protein